MQITDIEMERHASKSYDLENHQVFACFRGAHGVPCFQIQILKGSHTTFRDTTTRIARLGEPSFPEVDASRRVGKPGIALRNHRHLVHCKYVRSISQVDRVKQSGDWASAELLLTCAKIFWIFKFVFNARRESQKFVPTSPRSGFQDILPSSIFQKKRPGEI